MLAASLAVLLSRRRMRIPGVLSVVLPVLVPSGW